jgi:hypothetical protein
MNLSNKTASANNWIPQQFGSLPEVVHQMAPERFAVG